MKDSNDRAEAPVFPALKYNEKILDDYDTRKVLLSQKRNNAFFVL